MQRLCDWVKGRSMSVSYIYIYIQDDDFVILVYSLKSVFDIRDCCLKMQIPRRVAPCCSNQRRFRPGSEIPRARQHALHSVS